jgi:H+/Cl- antiporter ClcA
MRQPGGRDLAPPVKIIRGYPAAEQRMRSVLRIFFLILGVLFGLLGIATLTLFAVLPPTADRPDGLRVGFVHLAIAAVHFFAAWRLRSPKAVARGFDVVSKSAGDAEAG